jgi:hypothetical protein
MSRIGCLIPGCRRTREAHGVAGEWLCPEHWRNVPTGLRRAYRQACRLNDYCEGICPAEIKHTASLLELQLWGRIKQEAQARRFGFMETPPA